MEIRSYAQSLQRSRAARNDSRRPDSFRLRGREWTLLPDVFAPPYTTSTDAAMELLDFHEAHQLARHGSFLEIGCGTGVIAVNAALRGCERVLATDINPLAVRNTALNAQRHGVADRVCAQESDLFDALDPHARFDTVYWHSNFVLAPSDYRYTSLHEQAYVDPGYAAHRRYLDQAPLWTTKGGRALLQFSNRGDLESLSALADETERELSTVRSLHVEEGQDTIEYLLIEIARRDTSSPRPQRAGAATSSRQGS
ncbi:50S ribosomal protein L11 methyltransferase [Streptomyces sp. NPDC048594]|uniref:50S ribosomal protein L11 methyltransferase n=1 Tax=Streptomyces sp. NPDC048594 TaxID=3365575 RepID=UPI003713295F